MASSFCKVQVIGNVGVDPQIHKGQYADGSDYTIVNFSLATSYKKKDGNQVTTWHQISIRGKLAEVAEQYVKKGDKIMVEGELEYTNTPFVVEYNGKEVQPYYTNIAVQGPQHALHLLTSRPSEGSSDGKEKVVAKAVAKAKAKAEADGTVKTVPAPKGKKPAKPKAEPVLDTDPDRPY